MTKPNIVSKNEPEPWSRSDTVLTVVYGAFTLIVASLFAQFQINSHHDGLVLKPALDVLHGLAPFRDTFMMYGLLTTYLQAMAAWLGNETLLSIRILTAIFYAINGALVFVVWRQFMVRWVAVIAGILYFTLAPYWLIFLPWASVYAITFQFVALLLFFQFMKTGLCRYSVFSGIAVLAVLGSRQPVGIMTILAFVTFFLMIAFSQRCGRDTRHGIALFFIGLIVPLSAVLIWLYTIGALEHLSLQGGKIAIFTLMGSQPIETLSDYSDFFGHILNTLYLALLASTDIAVKWPARNYPTPSLVWGGVFVFSVVFVFSQLPGILRDFKQRQDKNTNDKKDQCLIQNITLLTALVSVASCVQYWPMPDFMHFFWGGGLGLGFYCLVISSLFKSQNKRWQIILTIPIIMFIFGHEVIAERIKHKLTGESPVNAKNVVKAVLGRESIFKKIDWPPIAAGMWATRQQKASIKRLASKMKTYVEQYPGTTLVNISSEPFLAQLMPEWHGNYHPLFVDYPGFRGPKGNLIYPNFNSVREIHIEKNRPLILSEKDHYKGYYVISNPIAENEHVYLLAPVDKPLELIKR